MDNKVNKEEFKKIFIEKLNKSNWNFLSSYIKTNDFDNILNKLYELRKENKRFTPPVKEMLQCFYDCNYKNLKIIILGDSPFSKINYSNGIAFDCSKSNDIELDLKIMLDEVFKKNNIKIPKKHNTSLKKWSDQGILLLNSSLSIEIDKQKGHYNIWNDFIVYILDYLNYNNENLIFLLLGDKAKEYEDLLDSEKHYIFTLKHPNETTLKEGWDTKDTFQKINTLLNNKINWLN